MKHLALALAFVVLAPAVRADAGRMAVEKGLHRIEQGAASYLKHRDCFSCHHQALPILSLTSARQRGFEVEPATVRRQIDFSLVSFAPKKAQIRKGQGIPGGNTMAAYALAALEGGGHIPDETTDALVEYLLGRQRADGSWPALAKRPPMEGGVFTNTALVLRGLRTYATGKDAKIDQAFAKGRDWLLTNKPADTEDKVFRLRGLVYAGADPKEIRAAREELLKEQQNNGSWAQLPDRAGDAYATGSVLVALRAAGLPPTDAAYQKGVKYLLATQKDDGSWLVRTRSRPVQVFFDNGDPGGKAQFISFAATNWAVLALLELYPVQKQGGSDAKPKPAQPLNLRKLNTDKDEDDPHVSSSDLHLFYTSRVNGKSVVLWSRRRSRDRAWPRGEPLDPLQGKADYRSVFLTRDGKYPQYLYFSTNEAPEQEDTRGNNLDIYFLIRQGAHDDFTTETPVQPVCTKADEKDPWLTPDGKRLYFSRKDADGWHVYVAARPSRGQFGKPVLVDLPAGFHHATLTPDGRTMYLQGPLEKGRWGLFLSKFVKAKWSEPQPLTALNSRTAPRGDQSPCLSRSGLLLYFASDRPGGKGGLDLWVIPTARLKK